jgi:hypothetical protein
MRAHSVGGRFPRTALFVATLAAVVGCGDDPTTPPAAPVRAVRLAAAADSLSLGDSLRLTARALDAANAAVPGARVQWRSLAPAVASVDSAGLVRGLDTGRVRVVAASGDAADTVELRVMRLVASLAFVAARDSLLFGDTATLRVVARDGLGRAMDAGELAWATLDPALLTVDTRGFVRAVGAGVGTVRVESGRARASLTVRTPFREVGGGLTFASVTSGRYHSCALTSLGRAYCVRHPSFAGVLSRDSVPLPVPGDLTFRTLDAGDDNSCGVTTTNDIYCWPQYLTRPPADPVKVPPPTPTQPYGQVAVTGGNACAIGSVDGTPYCWMFDVDGYRWPYLSPLVQVPGMPRMLSVATGPSADDDSRTLGCGLSGVGQVHCWTVTADSTGPYAFYAFPQRFVGLEMGGISCGLTSAWRAYCWGKNDAGQLGVGTRTTTVGPEAPVGGAQPLDVGQISAGRSHACAITLVGALYCWGSNSHGQLGNRNATSSTTPVAVWPDVHFRSVSAGRDHTCAVAVTGKLYCWGAGL